MAQFGLSERRACRLVGLARSTCQYRACRDTAAVLRKRLRALAEQRRRVGYRRLTVLLRREGFPVNHRRVYRLYREEGLAVRRRWRKRLRRKRHGCLQPTRSGQRSGYILARPSGGPDLDRLVDQRGRPEELVLDNGPEFIGRALAQWAFTHGVRLQFIAPGKPVQKAHIESFHGRDECLNEAWFLTVADARGIIEARRQDYNTVRPHSALGDLTPEEFEQLSRNGECGKQQAEPEDGVVLDASSPRG